MKITISESREYDVEVPDNIVPSGLCHGHWYELDTEIENWLYENMDTLRDPYDVEQTHFKIKL